MNFSGNKTITSIIIEMFSVIFAVLLALFAKDFHDRIKTQKEVISVVEKMKTEITGKRDHFLTAVQANQDLLDTLGNYYYDKFDFSKVQLGFADLFQKTSFRLAMTPITTISWETAKNTGLVKEFPYALLSEITKMNFLEGSLNGVRDELKRTIYNKDIFEPKETKKEFLTVLLILEDIIRKEKFLIDEYDKVLTEIDLFLGNK